MTLRKAVVLSSNNRMFGTERKFLVSTTTEPLPASNYIAAQEATGTVFTDNQKSALNAFIVNMKSAGIFDKMLALYLYVGASGNELNFINIATHPLTYTSSVTRNSDGIFINYSRGLTGISTASLSPTDYTWGYFSTQKLGSPYETISTDASEEMYACFGGDGGTFYGYNMGANAVTVGTYVRSNSAFSCLSSDASGIHLYRNGSMIATSSSIQSGWRGSTINIPQRVDPSRQYSMSFISASLTASQVVLMNNYVTTVMESFGRRILLPETTEFISRVLLNGGTIVDEKAIDEAFRKASEWGLDPALTHWSSPRFAYKLDNNGKIITRYCLFNHDAIPQHEGTSWDLITTPNKPPQMKVNPYSGFVSPALAWQSNYLTLSANVVATPGTNPSYPFYPIAELSSNWNSRHAWLIGVDDHEGYALGGISNPYCFAGSEIPTVYNEPQSFSLLVDPTTTITTEQVKFYFQGVNNAHFHAQTPMMLNASPFVSEGVYLGVRGDGVYYWIGNINDVFYTNKLLDTNALEWLESFKNVY